MYDDDRLNEQDQMPVAGSSKRKTDNDKAKVPEVSPFPTSEAPRLDLRFSRRTWIPMNWMTKTLFRLRNVLRHPHQRAERHPRTTRRRMVPMVDYEVSANSCRVGNVENVSRSYVDFPCLRVDPLTIFILNRADGVHQSSSHQT